LSQIAAALQQALPHLCAAQHLWILPQAATLRPGAWQAWYGQLQQFFQQLPQALPVEAQHAVESAWLDLQAQGAGLPLAALLCRAPQALKLRVPVHLLVHSVAAAQDAVQAGARILKIKLGAQPLADDVAYVAAIATAVGPTVQLRLDANAAWSLPVARQAVLALAKWAPAWLEQPVAATEVAAMAQLRRLRRVRIAADEAVHTAPQLQHVLACEAADVVVLKPMFVGGLLATCVLAAQAWQHHVEVVVTHALESAVGRMAAAHVAAALHSERCAAGLPSLACGLASSALALCDDVAWGPQIVRGCCQLSSQPGLGLQWAQPWPVPPEAVVG
jgi:L-alanine-DL-glutamate epimerase-like enolase superfamily enzyme